MKNAARVRLGVLELDLKTGELCNGNHKVVLQEQPLRILSMLIAREREIVSREEIRKRLWPNDTIVDFEHSINAAIKNLRRALGDSAENPKYIETVARRGYRLIVPVEWVEAPEKLSSGEGAVISDCAPSRMQVESASLIGKKVSHYRVLGLIGRGGMGLVYEAEDLKLGRRVALKFLPEELVSDPVTLQRFEREARTASLLDHPNICAINEVEEHEGQPFIVMQLLHGETLRDLLPACERKPLPLDQLLDIAIQSCHGLQAAHEKGIIHRDIKPANIFLTTSGQVKILDFGLAKLVEQGEQFEVAAEQNASRVSAPGNSGTTGSHLTRTGAAMGTAAYMSPEQVRGEKLDARTDLFSLGLVLYEMATRQHDFTGETAAIIDDAILNQTPVVVHELNSAVPRKLEAIITRAIEQHRELRYQTAAEMGSDLQSLAADQSKPSESGRSRRRSRWKWLPCVAVVCVAMIAGGMYWHSRKPAKLTDKDTIVLADFNNTTQDPVFDGTLRQGLSAQLDQSPFLSLVSDERIAQTLSLMAQPRDTRLTAELAREVCQRTASAATIDGSIASLGSQYVLGLKAVNCRNGDLLAEEQVTADGKEHVLKALGEAATKLRARLGESLASVQKYDAPPESVTTASLEALQAYSLGYREMIVKNNPAAAVPLFQRAISLDSNFPMAYARLGPNYLYLGETERAAESLRKAYELRQTVSERERFYIDSHYQMDASGNLEAARKTTELWSETYPRDDVPPNNLGVIYFSLGDYDKSLAAQQDALRLDPGSGVSYYNLVLAYTNLNRLDDAKATAQQAQARHLDTPTLHQALYILDFLQHDAPGMQREVKSQMGRPGSEDNMLHLESDTAAYAGRLARARELTRRAIDSAQHADEKETAAAYEAEGAVREALAGNMGIAKQRAQTALAMSKGKDVEAVSAMALVLAGDAARATPLADDLAERFPEDTIVEFNYLPTIRAATALESGGAAKAIEALARAAPYELGGPANGSLNFNLYPVYLRGLAFLAARQGPEAAAEFQKILNHPGIVVNEPIGALAHLGLGRAHVLSGEVEKARDSYQDFLMLWKDADPDIPILTQAKTEYAKLRSRL